MKKTETERFMDIDAIMKTNIIKEYEQLKATISHSKISAIARCVKIPVGVQYSGYTIGSPFTPDIF